MHIYIYIYTYTKNTHKAYLYTARRVAPLACKAAAPNTYVCAQNPFLRSLFPENKET